MWLSGKPKEEIFTYWLLPELMASLIVTGSIELGLLKKDIETKFKDKLDEFTNKNERLWNLHKDGDDTIIRKLDKAEIVFKTDIKPFTNEHIKAIQEIFESLAIKKYFKDIFILDDTSPSIWWSESMLGYLAVQGAWSNHCSMDHVHNGKVHRIFIFSQGELESTMGKKIIQYHSLLGLETYVVLEEVFNSIWEEYIFGHELYNQKLEYSPGNMLYRHKKEFVVWELKDEHDPLIAYYAEVSKPEEVSNKDICGYQSFWPIDMPYEDRLKNGTILFDIKNTPINNLSSDNDYPNKFEFITKKYENIAVMHLLFAKHLVSNSIDCYDKQDVVNNSETENMVLHISPFRKDETLQPDVLENPREKTIPKMKTIDSIEKILKEYSKHKTRRVEDEVQETEIDSL